MGMEGDAIDRRGKLAFSSVFFSRTMIMPVSDSFIAKSQHFVTFNNNYNNY